MNTDSNLPSAVIFTALAIEFQEVCEHVTNLREEIHSQGTIYGKGTFPDKKPLWDIGIVETSMGNARAALETERAIRHFKPKLALFVGIAGGLKDVKHGDIVIGKKVYNYESGKASTTFKTRPEIGNSTYRIVQRAQVVARKKAWLQRLGNLLPERTPNVYVGAIAVGEKVVNSTHSDIWKLLNANYEDTLALEMESYGFLQATQANQHIEALIVRGISDLIDDKSKADANNFQQIAARHASAFAFEVLAELAKDPTFYPSQTEIEVAESEKQSLNSSMQSNMRDQFNIQDNHGPLQVGSNNTIHNFFTNTPVRDEVTEGKSFLSLGKNVLLHGDYIAAKRYLEKADHLLREDQLPEESAQVKYLLGLVLLDGKRPFSANLQTMRLIEQFMETAIHLDPCYSYLYALSLFKSDFAHNGYPRLTREAKMLMQQANLKTPVPKDKENIQLLHSCQPRLFKTPRQQ